MLLDAGVERCGVERRQRRRGLTCGRVRDSGKGMKTCRLSVLLLLLGSLLMPVRAGEVMREAVGPWGRVTYLPIYLEVSNALVEAYPLPNVLPRWTYPDAVWEGVPTRWREAGLPAAWVEVLRGEACVMREGEWVHVFPPLEMVEAMAADVRARVYAELAQYAVNEYYADPVLILTDTVAEWYASSRLRPELIEKIVALSYRRGKVWAFSDLPLLLGYAVDEAEARLVFKSFTRTRTYLVRLVVSPGADVEGVVGYWSVGRRGFRLKDIEPLLSSIQETGIEVNLDIAHLLPALPRKLLYTYPGLEMALQGMLPDCHWTCLNFFNYEPHGYLLDTRLATSRVLSEYMRVDPPYEYGDILFFLGEGNEDAFHSCVYLADVLVFTKNGRNQLAPWIISTLEDVSRVYFSGKAGRIQGYRRKPK